MSGEGQTDGEKIINYQKTICGYWITPDLTGHCLTGVSKEGLSLKRCSREIFKELPRLMRIPRKIGVLQCPRCNQIFLVVSLFVYIIVS